jgi:hypothetical protein
MNLFWLCCPSFSSGRLDADLITDTANSLVSQYWEGHLWMAIRDGLAWFLFDHTEDLYYGRGFEMLAILQANFCPDTFSHAFTTLLSFVTNKQDKECIRGFWAHFEGHLQNISWSIVSIPPFFKPCSSCGHFILITKPSLTCLHQNRRTSPSLQLILLFLMQNTWMSLFPGH